MKTITYELPAYWASALINGDYSGLNDAAYAELIQWSVYACVNINNCLSWSEEQFIGRFNGLIYEMLEYTFIDKS